jgi:transposase
MAAPPVSAERCGLVAPLLPPDRLRPKGGRPPVADPACFTASMFARKTGIRWEDLPRDMGCGSGMTC